jgi:hypothetical protein
MDECHKQNGVLYLIEIIERWYISYDREHT